MAKHDRAHESLARQFHDREVEKEYLALVWGVVQAGRRIEAPIGRDPVNRQKMSARSRRARTAVTRITRVQHLKGVTLTQIAIHTGRTHQIRVHLSGIGHPIVGDALYGGSRRRVPADLRPILRLERPFLHAARLAFTHPIDGRRLEFTAALPRDLQTVLDEIVQLQEPAARRIGGAFLAAGSRRQAAGGVGLQARLAAADRLKPDSSLQPSLEPGAWSLRSMSDKPHILDSHVAYDGKIFQAVVERVRLPGRDRDSQVEIVRHAGSVAIAAMPTEDARAPGAAVPASGRRRAVGVARGQYRSRRGRRDGREA